MTMKKTLPVILSICALILVVGASPAAAQGRIATVDLKKLFDGYWKTKQADAALKERGADLEKEFKAMMEDYNKGKEDYKSLTAASSDPAMSDAERDKKKKEAEDKLRSLKEQEEAMAKFQNQARTTIDEQRRRMRDNILGEVRKALDGKAKLAGYSMVIDVAAETINNTPVVLYNTGDNDITDSVLSQLNASAPPEAQNTGTSSGTSTNKP
jgi:Skp family chaperone for outer membrane proteins